MLRWGSRDLFSPGCEQYRLSQQQNGLILAELCLGPGKQWGRANGWAARLAEGLEELRLQPHSRLTLASPRFVRTPSI